MATDSHDQNILPPRRQAKSAPSTPKKPRRIPISHPPIEHIPDLKNNLERLKGKKFDMGQRNLMTTTSTSAIRGQQFTVGNFSNGLIYLRLVAANSNVLLLVESFKLQTSRFNYLLCTIYAH